jgi:phospholipid/cholesterol/gamma-HCH transport system substrate-binding protein
MESKFNYAVVGAFVVVLGAALIGAVLWLTSAKRQGQANITYLSYMTESVAGLNVNAPVKYHGVDVGFVRGIEIDRTNLERVQLTLAIAHDTPVTQDTLAVVESQGLTGISYVDLTGGRHDSPPLRAGPGEDYPVIRSAPSLLGRLDTAVSRLVASTTRTSESLNALLDEDNRRAVGRTLADLQVVTRTLAARSSTIDAALVNATRTLANTAQFTADLPRLAARIERSAEGFDRMSEALARAAGSGATTFDSTRGDLQQFTSEGLPEIRQLVAELREMTGTLRRLGTELERDPTTLVWGKPAPKRGPGE